MAGRRSTMTAAVACAMAAMMFASGCQTPRPVAEPRVAQVSMAPEDLAVGDAVVVELKNGDRREFTIRALERDAIVSRDERIRYQDIRRIDRASVTADATDAGKPRSEAFATVATALAVLAIVAVEVAAEVYGSDEGDIDNARLEPDPTAACRDFGVCRKR